jgi:hypothetical protein
MENKLTTGSLIRGSLLFLMLISCSSVFSYGKIDKKLEPYVNTFKKYCELYKVDCSKLDTTNVYLEELPDFRWLRETLGLPPKDGETVGLCNLLTKNVSISPKYFEHSPPIDIEALVIHELAHCVLDKEHTEDTELDIMNPYMLPSYMYYLNYQKLLDKLFSCTENCPTVEFTSDVYAKVKRVNRMGPNKR